RLFATKPFSDRIQKNLSRIPNAGTGPINKTVVTDLRHRYLLGDCHILKPTSLLNSLLPGGSFRLATRWHEDEDYLQPSVHDARRSTVGHPMVVLHERKLGLRNGHNDRLR